MYNLAIFASGSGTNAENLIRYFERHPEIRVKLVLSNKPGAYVLERAKKASVHGMVFTRDDLYETGSVLETLRKWEISHIVLAGFLWLVPASILSAYPGRIINIHPALLPSYGGKGMYGNHVHRAVLENREKESGISIHYLDEEYDRGSIIFQARCPVSEGDSVESLAARVHELEYRYFPVVVERVILGKGMDDLLKDIE